MTVGYNAGEAAGVKGIYDYLYDSLCALGEPTVNTSQLHKLSALLYRLLHPHIVQTFGELIRFSQIMTFYVKQKLKASPTQLTIHTPYIMWTFAKIL